MKDDMIAAVCLAEDAGQCGRLLENAAGDAKVRGELAAQLQAALVACIYTDQARAARLNAAAAQWAALSGDALAAAYASRGQAHLLFTKGEHGAAASAYEAAADAFAALGRDVEEARTRSSGLQALIYLGRYEEARGWADLAEAAFLRHGDALRLARLDSNVGNIHFRLDQPNQAISRYERALAALTELGDSKDVAAVLSNLVVSHTSLGQFHQALDYYRQTTELTRSHGLAPLTAQADYNIAYLYFLRGDYAQARRAYYHSREVCRQTGDAYHAALCDLDESELALELNLTEEGHALARRAAAAFGKLGMRYEQAKAYVNLGVAASQRGELPGAGRLLRRGRALFAAEGNRVWPALIDLLRAVVAFHEGRFVVAQRLGAAAGRTLAETTMPTRAAHCQLLLARLWLREGQLDRAGAIGRQTLASGLTASSPSLGFHAHLLEGEVRERQGRWAQAVVSYEAARAVLEDLRGRLDMEDLRISLLKDKLAVYEALVSMALDSASAAGSGENQARALLLVQQAKSRSLVDRLLHPAPDGNSGDALSDSAEQLRRDLNWHYRQIELAALLERRDLASVTAGELRHRAEELEKQLSEEYAARRAGVKAATPAPAPLDAVDALHSAIPESCALVEYFEARGELWAFGLRDGRLSVQRLGSTAPLRQECRLLRFQMGRASVPGKQTRLAEAQHHLRELYRLLIGPIEDWLSGCGHLVFAPHRLLHAIPFAALHDGARAVIDRFTVSYAPSASVYAACRRPRVAEAVPRHSCVIAAPDPRNPHIEAEARAVAGLIPGSRLYTGENATRQTFLGEAAGGAHIMHLAAHGIFRQDNPMFSALQLAGERLSLLDLMSARCDVDLLTLSSCNSGLSLPVGGDELLGLMRGFLASGVRRLVASLWEVDDAATSDFMRSFYTQWGGQLPVGEAMARAMRDVRARYPHPYHWAPFILIGDAP